MTAVRVACWRRGAGPPLLLVHGSGEDHGRWRRLAGRLAARFTVYAMDRRGHGESADGDVHSVEAEAEDVGAVLRGIGAPAHLLGHSYGALCCLEAAAAGAPVRTLTLHEPCMAPGGSDVSRDLRALLEAGDREAVVAAFFERVVRASPEHLRLLRSLPGYAALIARAPLLVRELAATEAYRLDPARLRRLEVPVLLLAGGRVDSPYLATALEAIRSAVPAAELRLLPAGRHQALDTALTQVVAALTVFAR